MKKAWKRTDKKGVSDAMLYIWGFGLLFLFMLVMILFSIFSSSHKESLVTLGLVDTKINLLNYARTPVGTLNGGSTIEEVIINAYYSGDYKELDERTKLIFEPLYPKGQCLTWNMYYVLQPDGKEVHSIVNLLRPGTFDVVNWEYNSNEISRSSLLVPLVFEDKFIEVRFVEVC